MTPFEEYCNFAGKEGFEGFVGGAYLTLYKPDQLSTINHGYGMDSRAPGLVIFGSDGGGEAYGFDTREEHWPIVQVPFIGMDWKDAWSVAETFAGFLQHLRETPE